MVSNDRKRISVGVSSTSTFVDEIGEQQEFGRTRSGYIWHAEYHYMNAEDNEK
jgi:hypothetical protein